MKTHLSLIALLALTSCASRVKKEYSNERNCSARALEYMAKPRESTPQIQSTPKDIEIFKAEINKAVPLARQCFQEELDLNNIDTYNVCLVIGTSKTGSLDFIDVEDKSNPLPARVKNCMTEAFSKIDTRSLKNANVTQPINLYPRRVH